MSSSDSGDSSGQNKPRFRKKKSLSKSSPRCLTGDESKLSASSSPSSRLVIAKDKRSSGSEAAEESNQSSLLSGQSTSAVETDSMDSVDRPSTSQAGSQQKLQKRRKRRSKRPKERRSSKDECLMGWNGPFPNLSSAHSVESNSDVDIQTPDDLKALISTGCGVFPREEQPKSAANEGPLKSEKSAADTDTDTENADEETAALKSPPAKTEEIPEELAPIKQEPPEPEPAANLTEQKAVEPASVLVDDKRSLSSLLESPPTSDEGSPVGKTKPNSVSESPLIPAKDVAIKEEPKTPVSLDKDCVSESATPAAEVLPETPKSTKKRSASFMDDQASSTSKRLKAIHESPRTLSRSKSLAQVPVSPKISPRMTRSRSMNTALNTPEVSEEAERPATPVSSRSARRKTPQTGQAAPKSLLATDDFYKKPFEYGWKRELVIRSGAHPRTDVFFISPSGMKLRSKNEVLNHLSDDLKGEHFCFLRELQGVGEAYESVRHAVPGVSRSKNPAPAKPPPSTPTTPQPLVSGKRIPKPKGPKGASPPPEGWTPTMAVKGNARVLAASNSNYGGAATTSGPTTSTAAASSSRKRKSTQKSSSSTGKSNSAKKQAKQVSCQQCMAAIPKNGEAGYNENNWHLCANCLKPKQTKTVPGTAAAAAPAAEAATGSQVSLSNGGGGSALNGVSDDIEMDDDDLNDDGDALEIAEEIELPGQQPPAQLLSENGGKLTPKMQDIVVINGRKYISIVGDPVRPPPVVVPPPKDPPSEPYYNKYYYRRLWPREACQHFGEGMGNSCTNLQLCLAVLKILPLSERMRMGTVCKLWNIAYRQRSVWRQVSLRGSHITDWLALLRELALNKTQDLDMCGVSMKSRDLRMSADLGMLSSLRTLRTDACDAEFVEKAIKEMPHLRELRCTVTSPDFQMINLEKMKALTVLHVKMLHSQATIFLLESVNHLRNLTQLNIRGITNMMDIDLTSLATLSELEMLVLGSCLGMDTELFGRVILPQLKKLTHLRLENHHSVKAEFPIGAIMEGLTWAKDLNRLELINVDVDGEFTRELSNLGNVTELLLMPNYINNAAKTTNAIMQAISDNGERLKTFRLGLTAELLRMTGALAPKEKDKAHIPVVRPVPGVIDTDRLNKVSPGSSNMAPLEWAFLPVDRLESILHHLMPQAMTTVAKVSHSETVNLKF